MTGHLETVTGKELPASPGGCPEEAVAVPGLLVLLHLSRRPGGP